MEGLRDGQLLATAEFECDTFFNFTLPPVPGSPQSRAAKAAEIKETAKKYKRGENIDVKAVSRSRSQQDASKATKRKNKKGPKRKG